MAGVSIVDGDASPLVNVCLTQAEAESLACLCQAVRGSAVNSRNVHIQSVARGLVRVGIVVASTEEFVGVPYFKVNRDFDEPGLSVIAVKKP